MLPAFTRARSERPSFPAAAGPWWQIRDIYLLRISENEQGSRGDEGDEGDGEMTSNSLFPIPYSLLPTMKAADQFLGFCDS